LRIVADESVEGPTVSALRAAGHSVLFIAETSPGIEDAEVLGIARREQALLLTGDKDFGELVFRNRETHSGILLIRSLDEAEENAANTVAAIQQHGPDLLNRFSVLMGRALRIRVVP
jgi:predicted nuclease of predicted toxin-antitoxin system